MQLVFVHPYPTCCVEYAERGNEYNILFICSLFCEYIHIHLECVRIHIILQGLIGGIHFHIRVAAPQNT